MGGASVETGARVVPRQHLPVYLTGVLLALAAEVSGASAAELENRLRHHPAPYLALHGEDPVAWQPWDAEVLALARSEGRLLFVSVGYFSCHWCHVMQRESYQDPAVAALLNSAFVPVKIDRELQPAMDAALLEFVRDTLGYAGWPLNVFLTPEGYPVTGLVYAPQRQFLETLESLDARWRADPDVIAASARTRYRAMTTGAKAQGALRSPWTVIATWRRFVARP